MSDQNKSIEPMRHSAAHLLAYAVRTLFPGTQVAIGPVIENGFYYDFAFKAPLSEKDFSRIEQKMNEPTGPKPASPGYA